MNYIIVRGTIEELTIRVNSLIEGKDTEYTGRYVPTGGIAKINDSIFVQALIKLN